MNESHWLPGLVVLSLALVAAAVYLLLRRAQRLAPAEPLADATERAEALLAQLREHDAERHQLDPEAWQAEHDRLERAAADALRARDRLKVAPAVPASAPATTPAPVGGFFARHPQLVGATWGGAVVVFFGALGLWLAQEQKPREAGEQATGTAGRPGTSGPAQDDDAQFTSLLARVQESPGEDLTLTSEVVRELIRRSEFDQAAAVNDRSLSIDPFRPETRVHRAFLLAIRGDRAAGLQELRRLADLWPDGTEALLFSGMLHLQAQEGREALQDFEGYIAESPPSLVPLQLRQGVAELRRQVSGQP
jgi:tetratricopeptide (TPR) repeat protein